MRTTVAIEDRLLQRAKQSANESGMTLGALIEDALRDKLDTPQRPDPKPFRLITCGGGFAPGVDPHRLKELLLEEDALRYRSLTEKPEEEDGDAAS